MNQGTIIFTPQGRRCSENIYIVQIFKSNGQQCFDQIHLMFHFNPQTRYHPSLVVSDKTHQEHLTVPSKKKVSDKKKKTTRNAKSLENSRPTSVVSLPRYADTGLGVAKYSAVVVEDPIVFVNEEGGTE